MTTTNIDYMRNLRDKLDSLSNINEVDSAGTNPMPDPTADSGDDNSEMPDAVDDSEDGLINNLMTSKKTTDTLAGNIDVTELAHELGLDDTEAGQFDTAFDKLKTASTLGMGDFAAITAVFDRILSSDASTTSKVINQLRAIHKKSSGQTSAIAESNKGPNSRQRYPSSLFYPRQAYSKRR